MSAADDHDVNEQEHWRSIRSRAQKLMQQLAELVQGAVAPDRGGDDRSHWVVQIRDGEEPQTIVLFVNESHPHSWSVDGVRGDNSKYPRVSADAFEVVEVLEALNEVLSLHGRPSLPRLT